jgi:uncharacterized protein (DUF58 family)
MMVRPTARLVALAAAAPLLGIGLALIDPGLWIGALAYMLVVGGLTALDMGAGLLPRHVRIEAKAPSHLYIGDPNHLDVSVLADGRGAGTVIDVLLDVDEKLHIPPPQQVRLNEGGLAKAAIPIDPKRRGEMALEQVWLRWRGKFGLCWHHRRETLGLSVPAIPNIAGVRRAAILLQRRAAVFGVKPQIMLGDGSELDALKEHQIGMDMRSVDWKHSARHRKLLCKEYRTERNHNIVLAIDTGHLMREPLDGIPKLDRAINAALILAHQALAEGDRVGTYGFDAAPHRLLEPNGSMRTFQTVQLALSELDYSLEESNFTLGLGTLLGRLNRRSLVVLLTDFIDTITVELMIENIQLLAKRHLVLFVALRDPALDAIVSARPEEAIDIARSVAAADMVRERRTVIERLERLGVQPLDVAPQALDSSLLNRYLTIKQRELI